MFNLLAKHPDMKCHVSDLNSDLILTYVAIRDKVTEVIESSKIMLKNIRKTKTSITIRSGNQNQSLRSKKYQD